MSKKDNIDSFDTSHKSLYISLIVLFPIMFLVAFVIFYLVEVILLTNHYSIFEVLMIHKKNIAITGICMFLDTSMYLCCQIYLYEFRYNHSTFVDLPDCCRDKEKGLIT